MKSIVLFFALVGSSVLFYGCPICPEVTRPYYEIGSFYIWIDSDLLIEQTDTLRFQIQQDSIFYTASAETPKSYGGDAAFATSCPFEGERGLKSPIDSVLFFTQNDWDANHPAGSVINDLVEMGYWDWMVDQYVWEDLPDETWNETNLGNYFQITTRPQNPGEQSIFARIFTRNGKVVEGSSPVFFVE